MGVTSPRLYAKEYTRFHSTLARKGRELARTLASQRRKQKGRNHWRSLGRQPGACSLSMLNLATSVAFSILSTRFSTLGVEHSSLRCSRITAESPPVGRLSSLLTDLGSSDWQPLRPRSCLANPCFASSLLTSFSVSEACRRGVYVPFGIGPTAVLASSVIYWSNPIKESLRRTVDLFAVRVGMAVQVLLAWRYCSGRALPLILAGYTAGGACYACGRILTVRGAVLAGHRVHCGVHVFANLGNLLILPYVV